MKKLLLVFLSILVLTLFSSCVMSIGTKPGVYVPSKYQLLVSEYITYSKLKI